MRFFDLLSGVFRRSAGAGARTYVWGDLPLVEIDGSGIPIKVTPAAAQACGAVYSCVRLLSDSIAQLPCELRRRDGASNYPDTENPLYSVLNIEPFPSISSFTFWQWMISSMLLRGFCLANVIRDLSGRVRRLYPVHPSRVIQIEMASDGTLVFQVEKRDGQISRYPQAECFYVPYALGRDITRPIGPLHCAGRSVALANTAETYMLQNVKNNGKPNGYWKKDGLLSEEAYKRLKADLQNFTSGEAAAGSTPLVEEGLEFKPVALSAVDLQMIEQRRYTVADICGRFGVPPHKIGDTSQAKGWSTLEQQQTEFVTEALAPLCIRVEKEIRRQLIAPEDRDRLYAKFKFNALLRGDTNSRANFYQKMWQLGVMSVNEIRELEDMNPIPNGDIYYRPLNYAPDGESNE